MTPSALTDAASTTQVPLNTSARHHVGQLMARVSVFWTFSGMTPTQQALSGAFPVDQVAVAEGCRPQTLHELEVRMPVK